MFTLTHDLPKSCFVAASGGVDSMAVLNFLLRSNKVRGVIYVHHNTGEFADKSEHIVNKFCTDNDVPFNSYKIEGACPSGRSKEDWWREKRYDIIRSKAPSDMKVVLGHHLDDCLEEYIMNTLVRGRESTIKYAIWNCVRPFRKWKKKDIVDYATRNNIAWAEDPSNLNTDYKRNFIRHEMVPRALQLNPGLYKVVERIIDKVDRD